MLTKTRSTPRAKEQFDLNTVQVTGKAIAIWGRDGNVYVRLLVSTPSDENYFVNVKIPGGCIKDVPVTLQKEDVCKVTGYIYEKNFDESIRNFLDEAKKTNFINEYAPPEDIDSWQKIRFGRRNSMVEATDVKILSSEPAYENKVDLEGIVVSTWEYPRKDAVDRFARIAVYDAYTHETDKKNKVGRNIRNPHYINIFFVDGKVPSSPNPIQLSKKQRLRIRGELRGKWTSKSFHDMLTETGSKHVVELMQRLKDKDVLHDMKNESESLAVCATAVVVYSR